ncbi:MAG: ribosome maturation factor RimM [Thermostichales cyanobacterium SZTDM-1c_bins_54]
MSEWLQVARIVGVHGIRGLLKARLLSDFPERLTTPGQRWLRLGAAEPQPVTLVQGIAQVNKGLFLLRFQECPDRTTAETWVGGSLLVPAGEQPLLQTEEYYVPELLGVQVLWRGQVVGTVAGVITGAAQDLLEIQVGEERKLLPFVVALVPEVNLAQGWIVIDPPAGW